MKNSLLLSGCVALANAQSILWNVVDAAPKAPKVTVPKGGKPAVVHYDGNKAKGKVQSSIHPPRPAVTAHRGVPGQAAPLPTAPAGKGAGKYISPVSVPAPASTLYVVRRDGCEPQPLGSGPVPSPDTPDSFLSWPDFANAANGAQAPNNYVQTFANLQAANNDYGYLGFTTLTSYDTQACATACDNTSGCSAINIYFERDPSLNPDDFSCPNPASTTTIKCVFWGGPVDADNAKDKGKPISQFQVVMAGSNGYVKKNFGTLAGYTSPLNGDAVNYALNAPSDCTGANTFMGAKTFTDGPFDASLCAAACEAQTKYNVEHPPATGAPQTCQFFNTYMLMKNGVAEAQICAMANAKFTLQVQGGQFDKYYAMASNPTALEINTYFVQDVAQASQFQLDRSSQHLAILRPSGAAVLYANVNRGVTSGSFPYYFDTEASIVQSWQWLQCQITGGLLACNDGGQLNTNAYSGNLLYLTNGNAGGSTNVTLKALCTKDSSDGHQFDRFLREVNFRFLLTSLGIWVSGFSGCFWAFCIGLILT
ncbi:hypothetical protein PG994_000969 [Apiospora phragmitis]|uniref:Uncharacterized protein n=1 Tax=Apiospora phragmitis TaxID=2905665 RepID=A0ABR1WR34_9PEZI